MWFLLLQWGRSPQSCRTRSWPPPSPGWGWCPPTTEQCMTCDSQAVNTDTCTSVSGIHFHFQSANCSFIDMSRTDYLYERKWKRERGREKIRMLRKIKCIHTAHLYERNAETEKKEKKNPLIRAKIKRKKNESLVHSFLTKSRNTSSEFRVQTMLCIQRSVHAMFTVH